MALVIVGWPLLYQLLHPWHWLAYGQNAAVVGLIVVILYTLYTRRMMLIAQQSRRAELYPLLILQQVDGSEGHLQLLVVNVGGGPLLNASSWGQHVSARFRLGVTFLERPSGVISQFVGTLIPQGTLTLHRELDSSEVKTLEVIEGTDSVGGRHQFCLLRSSVGQGLYDHQVRMVHPAEFLPVWHRIVLKLLEWSLRIRNRFTAEGPRKA